MIADEIEKLQTAVTVAQEAQHGAERDKDQARTDLRLSKQREAELAASLETATAERDELKQQLGKARELERVAFDAEQAGLGDRQRASQLEKELQSKTNVLRATSDELDAVSQVAETLKATLNGRDAELVSVRADLASAAALLDALRRRIAADKTIAAESRKLKLEGETDV